MHSFIICCSFFNADNHSLSHKTTTTMTTTTTATTTTTTRKSSTNRLTGSRLNLFYCPRIMVLPSGDYQHIAVGAKNWDKIGEEVTRSPPKSIYWSLGYAPPL